MVQISNWDAIPDAAEFDRPTPGGYIGVITDYEDVDRLDQNGKGMYLKLYWDFAEGPLKGSLGDAFARLGYWFGYGIFVRSYKEKALPFFKGFKTCLEVSNPRYVFQTNNLEAMRGKRLGIVLGEEEYRKNDGTVGTRLYVAEVRSVKAIQDGDYKVPELKKLSSSSAQRPAYQQQQQPAYTQRTGYTQQPAQQSMFGGGFVPLPEDDGPLPF